MTRRPTPDALERLALPRRALWIDNRRSLTRLRESIEPSTPEGRALLDDYARRVEQQRQEYLSAVERATGP